ncbi:hypothetical protein C8R46DRAFT_1034700 [Mycena filopes]|nr:hypothetical protein C8R46DRAFT_1034700 [Mycena filopes]
MPVFPLQSLVALVVLVFGWQFSSATAQACPPTDKQSAKLKAASAAPKSNTTGFVTCTYDVPCNYFANGTFSNGPTVSCPDAIRNAGFLCPSFDGSPSSPPDGHALISSQNGTDPGVFTRDCYYTSSNHQPAIQDRVQLPIEQQHRAAADRCFRDRSAKPSLYLWICYDFGGYDVPVRHGKGSVLAHARCAHSHHPPAQHGAPVNGTSAAACPPSAIPILNSTFNNAGGGVAFNSTNSTSTGNPCPQPNKAGSYFASSSTGPGASGMVSCTYADSTQCTYLSADGSLKFGPSSCPSAITPLASTAPGNATSSILVAAVARNSRRSSTITDDNLPPDIIALLVMSAVLVLGTLALGGLWWFSFQRQRSLPPPRPPHYRVVSVHEQDYGHGGSETYDDPYEPASRNRK